MSSMDLYSQMIHLGETPAPSAPPMGMGQALGAYNEATADQGYYQTGQRDGLGRNSPEYACMPSYGNSPSPSSQQIYSPEADYKTYQELPACENDVNAMGNVEGHFNNLDMNQLQEFVESQLRQGEMPPSSATIKQEPVDVDFDENCMSPVCSPPPPQRRKGGRPRDPVVFAEGVPTMVVIKKERRKEQNRRAARKCREKKKQQNEHIMTDYHRVKMENGQLKESIFDLRRKLRDLEHSWKTHALKCSTLPPLGATTFH